MKPFITRTGFILSVGFMSSLSLSKEWLAARSRVDHAIGNVLDEFVQGNYYAVIGMCEFHLASTACNESTNTFLVSCMTMLVILVAFVIDLFGTCLQLLKGISHGCVGDADAALQAGKQILDSLRATPSVRTWVHCAPQLRNLVPVEVFVAYNRLVAPELSRLAKPSPKASPRHKQPTIQERVAQAHPWKFWGECPGGIKPWRPVVVSPSQFHRSSAVTRKVPELLTSKIAEKPVGAEYEVMELKDPEHINFPTGEVLSLRLEGKPSLFPKGDETLKDLFQCFEAMNFSPIAARVPSAKRK